MPGEIIDTNAEIVHENKAEWHLKGKDIGRLYAVAKLPRMPSTNVFTVFVALGVALTIYIRKGGST